VKIAARVEVMKKISAVETNQSPGKKKASPPRSGAGFLLVDCSLNSISFNAEAIQILGFPDKIENLKRSESLLSEEIRSRLIPGRSFEDSVFVTEFQSGRRRYFCRAFQIGTYRQDPARSSIAVLLERGPSGLVSLSQVCQQFKLTQREQEVLEYLLQGMKSSEIANRMNVSPNTVKAFLRLIMIKTGVASRSAIVGKIVMTQH
jgi:DNA-binding CsgD family transcriptional regulator